MKEERAATQGPPAAGTAIAAGTQPAGAAGLARDLGNRSFATSVAAPGALRPAGPGMRATPPEDAAIGASLARVVARRAAEAEAPPGDPVLDKVVAGVSKVVDALFDRPMEPAAFAAELAPVAGKPALLAANWPFIEAAVKGRKTPKPPAAVRAALEDSFQMALLEHADPEKKARDAAARELFDALLKQASGGQISQQTLDAEWPQIGPRAQKNIIGGQAAWPLTRPGLLARFGSLAGVKHYYEDVLVEYKVFGKQHLMHPHLAAALGRAKTRYAKMTGGAELDDIVVRSFGTVAIRPNTNNPTELSEHSYGYAFDLDGETKAAGQGAGAGNPNVPEAALAKQGVPHFWDFVTDITGEDVHKRGPDGKPVRNSATGTAAEGEAEAWRLRKISDKLQGMFAGEAAYGEGMEAYLARHGITVPPGGRATLVTESQALATATAKTRPQILARLTGTLSDWWRDSVSQPGQPFIGPAPPDVARVAGRLGEMGVAFRASGNAPGAGVEVPAANAIGTVGSIAAHGFMNLDPTIVGALTGSDGGGLTWLGAGNTTRDSMHFELSAKPGAQGPPAAPSLPAAPAVPVAPPL